MKSNVFVLIIFLFLLNSAQAEIVTKTSITKTNVVPTSAPAGTMFKFTATLNTPLTVGNKVKIDLGAGLVSMIGTKTSYSLSRAIFTTGSKAYKVGVYDAKNVLQSAEKNGTYSVGLKPQYTKIANNGSELPDSSKLGANPKDWACTKDNKTGFIWEVKTTDGGLRDAENGYSWYKPDANKNGGNAGVDNNGLCKISPCNTDAYTNTVNQKSLCGAKDWRMPTKDELFGIVKSGFAPTIDTTYFPNTKNDWFWSSSPSSENKNNAWYVCFNCADSGVDDKYFNNYVRLVRK